MYVTDGVYLYLKKEINNEIATKFIQQHTKFQLKMVLHFQRINAKLLDWWFSVSVKIGKMRGHFEFFFSITMIVHKFHLVPFERAGTFIT